MTYALETEQLMVEIEDSTGRISALIGAAKQYSQMDRAAHQEIDVRDGLNSTLVMLGHKIKESGRIKVVKDYDESLPTIPAHPAELNQVWTNLIDNAIHAMPDGGTLTVRTSREDGWVLVEICDTGIGIPVEMQQKIFEPFFTTKPVGQGTGLGPGHLLSRDHSAAWRRSAGQVKARRHPLPGQTAANRTSLVRLRLTALECALSLSKGHHSRSASTSSERASHAARAAGSSAACTTTSEVTARVRQT